MVVLAAGGPAAAAGNELADAGKAIVIASSDLEELTSICDRIGVLSKGRLAAVFERGDWSREKITSAAFSAYGSAS